MHIHSVAFAFLPDQLIAIERFFRDEAYPTLYQFPGFRRLLVLVNDVSGQGLILSFLVDASARVRMEQTPAFHALYRQALQLVHLAPISEAYRVLFEQAAES